ncbi:hypothetical protein B0H17DRAFT_1183681 [Mycena rosella]|uniref:Uncharacterized protein n=1 Tax=Mycena rosella TaxID=1033263 RepID=A0AAD7CZ94_MYCRO|nr:hypothetical protein B0H17DRAFT_1183681 [Mycena rosella]
MELRTYGGIWSPAQYSPRLSPSSSPPSATSNPAARRARKLPTTSVALYSPGACRAAAAGVCADEDGRKARDDEMRRGGRAWSASCSCSACSAISSAPQDRLIRGHDVEHRRREAADVRCGRTRRRGVWEGEEDAEAHAGEGIGGGDGADGEIESDVAHVVERAPRRRRGLCRLVRGHAECGHRITRLTTLESCEARAELRSALSVPLFRSVAPLAHDSAHFLIAKEQRHQGSAHEFSKALAAHGTEPAVSTRRRVVPLPLMRSLQVRLLATVATRTYRCLRRIAMHCFKPMATPQKSKGARPAASPCTSSHGASSIQAETTQTPTQTPACRTLSSARGCAGLYKVRDPALLRRSVLTLVPEAAALLRYVTAPPPSWPSPALMRLDHCAQVRWGRSAQVRPLVRALPEWPLPRSGTARRARRDARECANARIVMRVRLAGSGPNGGDAPRATHHWRAQFIDERGPTDLLLLLKKGAWTERANAPCPERKRTTVRPACRARRDSRDSASGRAGAACGWCALGVVRSCVYPPQRRLVIQLGFTWLKHALRSFGSPRQLGIVLEVDSHKTGLNTSYRESETVNNER